MTRTMRTLAVAVLAMGGAAAAPIAEPTLTFDATTSSTERTPQSAAGGAGAIDFAGSVQTPTPCYTTSAALDASSNAVTVTVTAAREGDACIQVIAYQNYTGQVSGLAAGTYRFRVVHVVGASTTTAYSARVTVS